MIAQEPVVAALGGTHSIGKSTQVGFAKSLLESQGFKVEKMEIHDGHSSPEREAKAKGFEINEQGNPDTQYYILANNFKYDLETRVRAKQRGSQFILYDRSVIDPLAYSKWTRNSITQKEWELYKSMVVQHLIRYPLNVVFVPEMLTSITDDGVRSMNKEFQLGIAKLFDEIIGNVNSWIREANKDERYLKEIEIVRLPVYSAKKEVSIAKRSLQMADVMLKHWRNNVENVECGSSLAPLSVSARY